MSTSRLLLAMTLVVASPTATAAFSTGEVFGRTMRWDAAPRTIEGFERSLHGGLRYTVEGGSYQAYRDLLLWQSVPTVAEFETAVRSSFAAWESIDPETGLGPGFSFVEDLGTVAFNDFAVWDPNNGATQLGAARGAEIDLLAYDSAYTAYAYSKIDRRDGFVDLTTGVVDYPGLAVAGTDIVMHTRVPWTLDYFQAVLTHEIGHAVGLLDVDFDIGFRSSFIDDDFDVSTSERALATLTNSFALLVDPFDPDGSPELGRFDLPLADPGLFTPGVDIVMGCCVWPSGGEVQLGADDYAGRQYLYPVLLPEPGSWALLLAAAAVYRVRSAGPVLWPPRLARRS